jgi:hypothetical protein
MSFALGFVTVLMVMGLLMPALGPALDHHYADRTPAHAHVFVGEATNLHEHSMSSHDHSIGESTGDGLSVVSTSASAAYAPVAIDGASLESLTPKFDPYLIVLHVRETPVLGTQAIAPLDRPPRHV